WSGREEEMIEAKSLVLSIKGPYAKDAGIYLTDVENISDTDNRWGSIGQVQDLRFEVSTTSLPMLSMRFIGFRISEFRKLEFEDGLIIFVRNYIDSVESMNDTIILKNDSGKNPKALGCVQQFLLETSVNSSEKNVEITGIDSRFFGHRLIKDVRDWMREMPSWVTVHKKNIDFLQEVGTDGVIDTLGIRSE